ncbi:MAG: NAD(P)-dependent oxidoreductase, partial [Alkalispirochaeta sp.]
MPDSAVTILAVDAYGVNPGDADWTPIATLGSLTVYPYWSEEHLRGPAGTAEIILVDQTPFGADQFRALPQLRFLATFSTGYDHIDLDAARNAGVAVANVPEYSRDSVAQLTIALILDLVHRIPAYNDLVHSGGWRRGTRFAYLPGGMTEVAGKTLGVLGLGTIGAEVARLAAAFGMRIVGWDARRKVVPGITVEWLPWKRFLAASDIISLHSPLTKETRRIIDDEALALMKRGAFLVNTSRGALIDDDAVARALIDGRLRGAALDVIGTVEPPEENNPLLTAPNCLITPHIGWATVEARQR